MIPVAETYRLWLPLKRLRRQTRQDSAAPDGAPRLHSNADRSAPLCGLDRSAPLTLAGCQTTPLHSGAHHRIYTA